MFMLPRHHYHACIRRRTHTCAHGAYTYTFTHAHAHARKHTCMHAHKHTHARNHIHACVHTRTHSCVSDSSFPFLYATDPQWSIIFYLLFFSATDIFQSMKAKPKKKEGRRRKGQVSTVLSVRQSILQPSHCVHFIFFSANRSNPK